MVKKATRVFIFGAVQGVFFRVFIKEEADKLGIKGYVRNKDDGSVEAWFEGNSQEVNRMIEKAKEGPKHAMVKRLDIVEESFEGYKEFKVLRF